MVDSQALMDLPTFPPHFLTSNNVPSESERVQIQSIIDRDYTLLESLDVALEVERKRVLQHAQQGLVILSAVRRVPFDILAEIFSYFRGKSSYVWRLGHVCRPWKAAILALPALWSNIKRFPRPMTVAHLEYSKPSPLTIHLGAPERSALRLVVQHSERWETVRVDMGRRMPGILSRVHGRLPLLRTLTYQDLNHRQPCRAFEIAPLLTEASIKSKAPVALPWAQLKRLFILNALEPLKLATNLVELTVFISYDAVLSSLPSPAVLPHLRRLLINEGDSLRNLVCPALEDLHVLNDYGLMVMPFIDRSACCLRTFTSECPSPLAPVGAISILNLVPTLVELRLIGMPHNATFIPHLNIPLDDVTFQPLGPALRSLSITLNINDESVCAAIIQMMESRHKSSLCPRLSLCVLHFLRAPPSVCALSTCALLRDRHGLEVEWLMSDAAVIKKQSWELEFPW